MDETRQLLLAFGAFFFMAGLLTGVWKYLCIARSSEASAPVYVDIAHRAAMLYAFATLILDRFVEVGRLSAELTYAAVVAQLAFFALAWSSYLVHGILRDTDNQLARPHRLGRRELPPAAMVAFMLALIIAEVGGFAVLVWGAFV